MQPAQKETAIVTGAAGMIGSHLIHRLVAEDYKVIALVHRKSGLERLAKICHAIDIREIDIRDQRMVNQLFALYRPQLVFHLASTAFNPPTIPVRSHVNTIVGGTLNLLEAAAEAGTRRFLFAGTAAVYASGPAMSEACRLQPATHYGAAKAAAAMLLHSFAHNHDTEIVELRLFTPYGAWERASRLIPAVILSALRGEDFAMTGGLQQRDYVHIDDVVEAFLQAAQQPVGQPAVYNVGSGMGTAVKTIAQQILQQMGNPVSLKLGAKPMRSDEIMEMAADTADIRKDLNWQPTISLQAGLAKTIDWYVKNTDLARQLR